jgi:Tfp pilus assembly protein PilX
MMYFSSTPASLRPRGFTLILAMIFTTVVLSVGLALADVAYKQVILASNARQSEYAFYAADAALECALYQDQKLNTFSYTSEPLSGSFTCESQTVNYTATSASGGSRTTTFSIPCAGGGAQANLVIKKNSNSTATLDAGGFNNCNASDPNRVERGVKASY